jgi:hypothetical protein
MALTQVQTGMFDSSNVMFRNRIINGDMRIDQRNAGASISPSTSAYSVDRFLIGTFGSGNGRLTAQQSSTVPNGFVNSLSVTVSTVDTSYSGSEGYVLAQHKIEGVNISDFDWGTANAKTVTLSFWTRSSVTGNLPVVLQNSSGETAYGALYTISSADTWEYKTITVSGATTGTWLSNTSAGLSITFGAGGKDPERTSGVGWNTVASRSMTNVTGATQLIATSGATWYITGVQLEVGSVATEFERRPYGTELALCQRYFQRYVTVSTNARMAVGGWGNSTDGQCMIHPPVTMRSTPTLSVPVRGQALQEAVAWRNITANSGSELSASVFSVAFSVASSTASQGQVAYIGGANFDYQFSSEL